MIATCSNPDCRAEFNIVENPSQYCSNSCQNLDIYRFTAPSRFVDDFVEYVAKPSMPEPSEVLPEVFTVSPAKRLKTVRFKKTIATEVTVSRWYPRVEWKALELVERNDKQRLWQTYQQLTAVGLAKKGTKSTDSKMTIAKAVAAALVP